MQTPTRLLFTAAMRDHARIVSRAERRALAVFTVCYACSAAVIATAILFALAL